MAYIRQLICDRCKKAVPVSEIRYIPKGRDSTATFCLDCISAKKEANSLNKKTNSPGMKTPLSMDNSLKEKYICMRCNYAFEFNTKSRSPISCPYCSKSDRLEKQRKKSAQDLIKDIN